MSDIDLNLLVALDSLLVDCSVAGAARRLGLSSSAMSRTLARLRAATGDPLLVRAGRGLVPTPRAAELRDRVRSLTEQARSVLRPAAINLELETIERTFVIRANEGFVEKFAAPLVAAMMAAAPGVCLRFAPKPDKDARPLREGELDLEVGIVGESAPEIRIQTLFRDRFVGLVRNGHPLLDGEGVTPQRYAACAHVVTARRGDPYGPVDEALGVLGLKRTIVAVVPTFRAAIEIARASDLVALMPEYQARMVRAKFQHFALPVSVPGITISQMWHPRMDADPAHRWLRGLVATVCAEQIRI